MALKLSIVIGWLCLLPLNDKASESNAMTVSHAGSLWSEKLHIMAAEHFASVLNVTFLVLVFVFWYLIRTMLLQRSLEEMKDDFTHNITHELKTPMSVAYAANDALLQFADDLDRETRENYLRMSLEQLRKLGGMIEQILSTSMKRRKTFTLNKEELDLRKTLAEIVEEQRLRANFTYRVDSIPFFQRFCRSR